MKDNNILILLICFIVLTFVVYFYINNNMLVTEDFTSFEESAARNYEIESDDSSNSVSENDDYRSESNHMNSIIAKYSGKMLNIIPVGQPKTKKCIVPFYDKDGKKALSLNNDGTYSLRSPDTSSNNQQFRIVFVTDSTIYDRIIPLRNKNLGYHVEDAKYPFYLLIAVFDETRCLQYQDGNVSVRPLANYDSQKWDLSEEVIENVIGAHKTAYESRLTGDVRSNPDELGSNEYEPSDNIKVKLNLDNQVLNNFLKKNLEKLVTVNEDNNNSELSELDVHSEKIDLGECSSSQNYNVPKNSVKSLCKGCNTDLIV